MPPPPPSLPPPDFIKMNSIHNVIFTELELKTEKEKHVLISTAIDSFEDFFFYSGYNPPRTQAPLFIIPGS